MKFILSGRTFDTAGSTKMAIARGIKQAPDGEMRFEHVLYRTAKGAIFVHEHSTQKVGGRGRPVVTDQARELSQAEAVSWIVETGAVVLDSSGLQLPDEA